MKEQKYMFQCLTPYRGRVVTFRGNKKGRITGVGKIGIHLYHSIDNILFVEGLKHNLQNISQLCDNGYDVSFNKDECVVLCHDGSIPFILCQEKRKPLQNNTGRTLRSKCVMLTVDKGKSLVMT